MRSYRVRYYDAFARVYDRFVAAHSRDPEGRLREVLADHADLYPGARILDLCTGTGAMLPALARRTGAKGLVAGLDFSRGMLEKAAEKTTELSQVVLVQADAECLPIRDGALDAVTCSHAFYELKGEGARRALGEVARTLAPERPFVMMEHDLPERALLRFLFYIRLLFMGLRKALEILGNEEELFRRHFDAVERVTLEGGRSKIFIGRKAMREQRERLRRVRADP